MEINITSLFREIDAPLCSGSRFELGDNAGQITWDNSIETAKEFSLLDTDEKRQAFRDYVKGFGAWDADEIAAWNDLELNALFVQLIAGDMRESGLDDCHADDIDWQAYEQGASEGQYNGNIYKGDNGQIFYYVGY